MALGEARVQGESGGLPFLHPFTFRAVLLSFHAVGIMKARKTVEMDRGLLSKDVKVTYK